MECGDLRRFCLDIDCKTKKSADRSAHSKERISLSQTKSLC